MNFCLLVTVALEIFIKEKKHSAKLSGEFLESPNSTTTPLSPVYLGH